MKIISNIFKSLCFYIALLVFTGVSMAATFELGQFAAESLYVHHNYSIFGDKS